MLGNVTEDISQVGLGIEAVQLGRFDQRVEGGCALGAPIRAGEQLVLAPDRDTAQRPLGRVNVEPDATVIEHPGQRTPAAQHVAERLGQVRGTGELWQDRLGLPSS